MPVVDLRSDTVTQPTDEMRHAMAHAEVGDDVYGDDPTINLLQERAADLVGKQTTLFVPSGTMGNQLGVLVNTPRGHALIADALSHVLVFEAGGAATLAAVPTVPITTERGVVSVAQLDAAIAPDDVHRAPSSTVVVENSHNLHGGVVWPVSALHELCEHAHRRGLRVHLDGARLFNAALASKVSPKELTAEADTVTFCLSKGLSCPVGSLFCGTEADIAVARRWRKMLGGGMRQGGILAAAGLVAFDTMIGRLADDHGNARRLAEGLAKLPGVQCDLGRVETNIVYFDVPNAASFIANCAAQGVLGGLRGGNSVRFVTHRGISSADVDTALTVCGEQLSA